MEKAKKKRGRPAIKPYIEQLIVSRVLQEQAKPPEERMPVKVLAYEIQKQISQTEVRPPESSTLEKRISKVSSTISNQHNPLDEPWTILSLSTNYIPPEALQAVIKTQADAIKSGRIFSVREALWLSRFYFIMKGTKIDFDSGLRFVERTAVNYARVERIFEVFRDAGKLPLPLEGRPWTLMWDDAVVYLYMTDDSEPLQRLIQEIRRNPDISDLFLGDDVPKCDFLSKDEAEAFDEWVTQLSNGLRKAKKEAQDEK